MKIVKLIAGRSYGMKGFSCVNDVPVSVEDTLAEYLLTTGKFVELVQPPVPAPENDGEKAPASSGNASDKEEAPEDGAKLPFEPENTQLSADEIAGMKKDELIELAAQNGIDISDCKNNDERAAKIQGALGLASTVQMGLE